VVWQRDSEGGEALRPNEFERVRANGSVRLAKKHHDDTSDIDNI